MSIPEQMTPEAPGLESREDFRARVSAMEDDDKRRSAGRRRALVLRDLDGTEAERQEERDLVKSVSGLSVRDFDKLCPVMRKPTTTPSGESTEENEDEEAGPPPHRVMVSTDLFFYAHGPEQGCDRCDKDGRPRGLYYGAARFMGDLPYVRARVIVSNGRNHNTLYLLAKAPEAGRAVVVAPEDVETGKWAHALVMTRSADRRVKDAAASAIFQMGGDAPKVDYALKPTSRTEDGKIPLPVADCLPMGYFDRPEGATEAQTLQGNRELAALIAQSPKLALLDGAAVGGTFSGPLGLLSAFWNSYGGPRQGKTTCLLSACSNLGNPGTDSTPVAMINLNSTKLGANAALGELGIFPAFFNESGTAGFTPADWARFIFSATGGNSRSQAPKNGGGRNITPGWAGVAFISGNARVADGLKGAQFSGIAARVIEVPAPITVDAAHAEAIEALVPRCYGYVLPLVLEAFTVAAAAVLHGQALGLLDPPEEGTARTVAKALAVAVMGAMMKDTVLGTGSLLTDAAVTYAREYLSEHRGEPESDADLILTQLRSELALNRGEWPDEAAYTTLGESRGSAGLTVDRLAVHGYDKQSSGVLDVQYVYVSRGAWERLCETTGADGATALRMLHEAGALHVSAGRRKRGEWTATAPNWAGRFACYKLKLSALEVDEDEDGTEDGGNGGGSEAPQGPQDPDPCKECGEGWYNNEPDPSGYHPNCDPAVTSGWGRGTLGGDTAREEAEARRSRPAPRKPVESAAVREVVDVPAEALTYSPARPGRKTPEGQVFARLDQEQAYRARVAVLDAMDPEDDSDEAINKAASALRIAEAMTDDPGGDKTKDGPFAPAKYGKYAPTWTSRKAPLPDIAPPLVAHNGWGTFKAETDYRGTAAVLDRNAGHPSALSSLRVAHGPLEATGALPDARRPGYYKTVVHPWTRADLPSPMANREVGTEVWVTHERMRLLIELAELGAEWWPDATILDSHTAERETSMRDLSQLIKHLRAHVIDTHGKDSAQWEAVKEATNTKLIQILMGSPKSTGTLDRWIDREWFTKCHRTDWAHALHDKAAMNLYRVGLKLTQAEVTVLAMRHMDEILIPADEVEGAITRGLIKADEEGRTFGTFKTKDTESWGA